MVYVTPVEHCAASHGWPYRTHCYLFADDPGDLHEVAQAIGLLPTWFRAYGAVPCYEITQSKRAEALTAGAEPQPHSVFEFAVKRSYRELHTS